MSDTIAAIATAPGKAGVAVIRISGDEAFEIAAKAIGRPVEVGMKFMKTRIDECLVLGFKRPRSYTGEDTVEIQCHGGAVTPRRFSEALFAAGARLARRGEFTERAFLNGKLDYDQAESVLDLINAKTVKAAEAALEGLKGARKRELGALYESALKLSSGIEHALDISEEELPAGFLNGVRADALELKAALAREIRRLREGKIVRDGALVVLAGPPNAGKSSLMNALLEENRAIVSDIPGTTRDSIEEWMDLEGYPIRLVDTAGLRESDDRIEAEGVRRAEELIAKADVVLQLGEGEGIKIHAKCDLDRGEGLNVSAKTGEGLVELKKAIVSAVECLAERMEGASGDDRTLAALVNLHEQLVDEEDIVLLANRVRHVAESLGTLIGARYSEDLLTDLFNRFCVGK